MKAISCLVLVFSIASVHAISTCTDSGISIKQTQLDAAVTDVVYACDDSKTIFVLTEQRTVWRSDNEGRDWTNEMERLAGSTEQQEMFGTGVAKIIVSAADRKRIFLQGVGKYHWTSSDCGKKYEQVGSDRVLSDIQLHPRDSKLILASAFGNKCYGQSDESQYCSRQLWISKDFGKSFTKKVDFVQGYQWGAGAESVLYSVFLEGSNHQPLLTARDASLMYTRNLWKTSHKALDNVVGFKVLDGHLYAATQGKDGLLELHTSKDDGVTMLKLHFPSPLAHHRYVIVSDGMAGAFIGVMHGADWGTLYASNGNSVNMVVVLRDVPMGFSAHLELVSAESGALLFANVAERGVDGEGSGAKRTVVSFDRGANWKAVTAPENFPCKESKGCSLHLHTGHKPILSQHREDDAQQGIILAKQSAAGIIAAVGNIGPTLDGNPDAAFTVLSRDGGGRWERIMAGTHAFDMGGHGAVIAAVKNYRPTNHLHFNVEEGSKFHMCDFSADLLDVTDIVTEPNGSSIAFFLYGRKKDGGDAVIVHMDFRQLLPTTCRGLDAAGDDGSDFEFVTLSDGTDKHCLNGEKTAYSRRKKGVTCVYSKDYVQRTSLKPCPCTEEDFECNFCYERKAETSQIAQQGVSLPTKDAAVAQCVYVCKGNPPATPPPPPDCKDFYTVPTEYRKVAGNRCHGGLSLHRRRVPCSSSSGNSVKVETIQEAASSSTAPSSIVSEPKPPAEEKPRENEALPSDASVIGETPAAKTSSTAGAAVAIIVFIAFVGVIAFFVYTNKSSLGGGWSLNIFGQNQYSYAKLAHRLDPDDLLDDDMDDDDDPSSLENAALASIGRGRGGLDCRVLG